MNIEKKIIQIWIGPNPAPQQWIDTWKEKHPDWDCSVFTDEMLKSRKWKNQHLIDHYYQTKKWPGVSDLIRYELLYEQGGFMPEADSVCLERVDELFTSPPEHAYTCWENEKAKPGYVCPVLAANPGNAFLKDVIDILHASKPEYLSPEPFRSTGNLFLAGLVPRYRHMLTIWPSYFFVPQWYVGPRYDGPGKIYADQFWGSTGQFKNVKTYDKGII